MSIYYVDGAFVPEDEAQIPVTDLSVLRGYGVFDYLRTYHGIPVTLAKNIQRLQNSAELIGLACPYTADQLQDIILETLERNGFDEADIRIVLTGGLSQDNFSPNGDSKLLVMVRKIKPLPEVWYTDGVKIITVGMERFIPGAKSINYIPGIMAIQSAKRASAIEAVYVDKNGNIREGTTTNIFAVFNGTLATPPEIDLLPGITRSIVLEITQDQFPQEEREISLDELYDADEVFITAANKRILPVVKVNDRQIGNGKVGTVTREAMKRFDDVTFRAKEPLS